MMKKDEPAVMAMEITHAQPNVRCRVNPFGAIIR